MMATIQAKGSMVLAMVRVRLPLAFAVQRSFCLRGGRSIVVQVVWCGQRRWVRLASSRRLEWSTIPVGPFLIALRVRG